MVYPIEYLLSQTDYCTNLNNSLPKYGYACDVKVENKNKEKITADKAVYRNVVNIIKSSK